MRKNYIILDFCVCRWWFPYMFCSTYNQVEFQNSGNIQTYSLDNYMAGEKFMTAPATL